MIRGLDLLLAHIASTAREWRIALGQTDPAPRSHTQPAPTYPSRARSQEADAPRSSRPISCLSSTRHRSGRRAAPMDRAAADPAYSWSEVEDSRTIRPSRGLSSRRHHFGPHTAPMDTGDSATDRAVHSPADLAEQRELWHERARSSGRTTCPLLLRMTSTLPPSQGGTCTPEAVACTMFKIV